MARYYQQHQEAPQINQGAGKQPEMRAGDSNTRNKIDKPTASTRSVKNNADKAKPKQNQRI
jgi:hypothetical protein